MKKSMFLKAILLITLLLVLKAGLSLPVSAQAWDPDFITDTGLPGEGGSVSVYGIIENLMSWILAIFGILGVIGFAISGILYLTAAGDDDQIKKAKKAMNYSLIGLVVGLSGLVVIYWVDNFLNAEVDL